MSAKIKVLRDMDDGTSWGTITETHSKSSIYAAYNDFMPTMENNIKKVRLELTNLEQEKKETQQEVTRLHNEIEQDLHERDEAKQETAIVIGRLAEVREELDTASQELNNIYTGLGRLSEKNISEDLVSSLSVMDVTDDEDLLTRISTADQFQQLSEDVEQMESKLAQLSEKRSEAEIETRKHFEELKSVRNQIAIARSEHSLIIDAIDVTNRALRKYSKKDLIQLFKELDRIMVRGEPKTTLNYMLDRLDKVKEELEIEANIISLKKEKSVLEKEVATVKGVFIAYRDGVNRPIQEAQDSLHRVIQEETQSIIQAAASVRDETVNTFNDLAQTSASAIENTQKQGERRLDSIEKHIWNKLFNLSLVLEARIDTFIEETEKWGNVKEEAGQYTFYLNQAILLLGPLVKPESILALDPWVVKLIAKRLHLYAQKKFAGVKTRFPADVARRELAINETFEVQITSVAEALALILDDLLKEW